MGKNTDVSLNDDVNVIRDILFGDQLKNIQQRIKQLESALLSVQEENHKLRQLIDAETENRLQAGKTTEKTLNSTVSKIQDQINRLDEHINTTLNDHDSDCNNTFKRLDRKISRTSTQLKKQTAEQFANHEALHEDLVKMLALALLKYQEIEGGDTDI